MISTYKSFIKLLFILVLLSTSLGLSAFSIIKQSQVNENNKPKQNITAKPTFKKTRLATKTQRELSMLIPGNKQFNVSFLNHLLINNKETKGE